MSYHPDLLMTAVKLVMGLLFLTGLLLVALYGVKKVWRNGPIGAKDRLIRILDTRYLGPRKTITVVEIAGTVLVLGVTAENIQLLATLNHNMNASDAFPVE